MTFEEYYLLIRSPEDIESAKAMYNSLYGASEEKPAMPELTLELLEAMGKAKGWGLASTLPTVQTGTPVTEQHSSTPPETSTAVLTPVLTTPAASSNSMLQRVRGIQKKTKYGDFENLINLYGNDGEISRADRRAMRKELGLSRKQMRGIAKGLNGGDSSALNAYTKGLEKRSYIDNGKLIIEGEGENFDPNAFNTAYESAKYKGTDINSVVNLYNLDVLNWRKGDLTYSGGKYKMRGFEEGPDVEFDENNLPDWLKNDTERLRSAQLQSYFNAVNDYNNLNILNQYSNENLAKTLGLDISEYNAYNDEDKLKFRKDATRTLFEHLDKMRNSLDGTFNFNGNVLADAIMKSLINNQSTSALPWLGKLGWNNEGTYGLILLGQKYKGTYSLLAKKGAVMNYIRKHEDGGKSENKNIGVNRNFSKAGWFGLERFSPEENMFGWNEEYLNGHYRYSTPDPNVNFFVNKNNGNVYLLDLDEYNLYKLGNKIGNVSGPITDDGLYEVYMNYFTKHPTILDRTSPKEEPKKVEPKPNTSPNKQEEKPEYKAYKSRYSNDYNSKHYYATYKNGGLLNMNKINYFLEGGAMAPLAAPAAAPTQGGQDILTLVMLLVLAAMSGDEQATLAIQQIMLAAQQGDQLAMQIALMILEVTKQMQGLATAAKYGSKLSYLKSLRSGCPEGYEVSYHKKGGVLCKECIKMAKGGAQIGNGLMQVNLIKHGSFDNSTFGKGAEATAKVKWLQNQMFTNGMNGRSINDNRVDGKWRKLSLAQAQKQGWVIGTNGNTLMLGDRIYNWDPNTNSYIEEKPIKKEVNNPEVEDPRTKMDFAGYLSRENTRKPFTAFANFLAKLATPTKDLGNINADYGTTNQNVMANRAKSHKCGGNLKTKLACGNKMQEGSKVDEAKCGTKVKAACGTKATMDKCGSKLKKKLSCGKKMQEGDKIDEAKCGSKMKASCGAKATMDKCGGKAKKKCLDGAKVVEDKCGGKAKKKCLNGEVLENKCGGKTKKKKCLNGGILTLEALQTAYKSLYA